MTLKKVFISNPTVPKVAYKIFENSVEVITSSETDKESIIKCLSRTNVDALFWAGPFILDKEIIDAAGQQLKVVCTMSAGYNQIDTSLLKTKGILLGNTPEVSSDAVADIALLLAMAASRRYTEGRRHIEEGTWETFEIQWMLGQDISGSTVGIIGFGSIGQAIAKRLRGFGVAKILYTGHGEKPEGKEIGAQFVNQETLNTESDFIFLAAPLTNETNQMCNAEFFSKMKRTGIIVNISRGQLIDQAALIRALRDGEIFAAGLDVMDPEPLNKDSDLLKLSNIVLTPHIGSATYNTRNAMAELTAKNILRALNGEEMITPVKL